jgi:site-specific DNA recombinase
MKMAQAALYARVSTRRQEQEATIESQLAQILAHADKVGESIPKHRHYLDQAVSGNQLMRPGLDRLRDEAAMGLFERLYCLTPDRLARNLGAQQVVLNELERRGIQVIFVNQPDVGDGPQAQLLLNIQGAFAEYERILISERMRRGRLHRLRHGGAAPYPAPYGYLYQPAQAGQASRWVVVPHEAEIVKQMFEWYTQQGLTLSQIANYLNQQKTPSPQGKGWTQQSVQRIIGYAAYKGVAHYNRHRTDADAIGRPRLQGRGVVHFPRYLPRKADEWIAVSVPTLVDESLWQAAQEQLSMNTRFAQRNSRNRYLLRGLLVCDVCGYTIQGASSRDTLYYRCTHGGKNRPLDVPHHTRSLRADLVEPLIWQALAELLDDPQRIRAVWHDLHHQQRTAPEKSNRWRAQLEKLDDQRLRLVDAYAKQTLTQAEFVKKVNPVMAQMEQLKQKLAAAPPSVPIQIDLDTFTHQIQQALAAPDFETQQEVIRLLIDSIVVTDDALIVKHIVPTIDMFRLEHTFRVA